ncbi:hypothetical protein VPZ60_004256 [Salmonella enterica]|nr:hypothetical protein [Salmonella enterica]
MDYQRIYDAIIDNAIALRGHPASTSQRRKDLAVHHILPACLFEGGRKDPAVNVPGNLVWLDHRSHFIAHWCLARLYGDKLAYAFAMMCKDGRYTGPAANSRHYATYQMIGTKARWSDPEQRKRHAAQLQRMHADPAHIAKKRAMLIARNTDPDFIAKARAGRTPESEAQRSEKISKANKVRFSDPERLAAHREWIKKRTQSESWRAANKASTDAQKKPVIGFEIGGDGVMFFPGLPEARAAGLQGANISACCRGVRPKAHGYTWRFATPEEIAHHSA